MKKRKKTRNEVVIQNPVAKFAHHFNKATVFADKTQYRRKAKHRKQEVSLNTFLKAFKESFCFSLTFNWQHT